MKRNEEIMSEVSFMMPRDMLCDEERARQGKEVTRRVEEPRRKKRRKRKWWINDLPPHDIIGIE